MSRRTLLASTAAVVLVAALAAWLVSPETLFERLRWVAADPVRFVAVLTLVALVRPLLAWPTTLLAVVVGYTQPLTWAPVALALVVVSSVPPYFFGRHIRGDSGRFAAAGERFVDTTGDVRSVAASRLFPAPSDIVSVGAGVADVRLRSYVLGTAVGETPWVVGGVLVGGSLGALTADSLTGLFDVRLVAGAAAVGVLLLAGPLYRYASKRNVKLR
ncbi:MULTISPECIES: TVP38/TMEM64 family protein [Haloprofundus]|uniref:TVP38/TMEM64 family protein n=1 Tax=Haloprofundus TaxID=1911573 RepID=UPI000E43EED3|nr:MULTISPECIES: VTT domain-containing protein [Haloprofundus]QCJ46344.1 TVP38/TMEM64 family protein [Haloprofundus sp. MHR1]